MLCEKCENKTARFQVSIQTNFEKEQTQLCETCYDEMKNGWNETSPFSHLFDDILENHLSSKKSSSTALKRKNEKQKKRRLFLDEVGTNLTEKARAGKIDGVIGREEEIEQVMEILNRRNKNNPVLIGEPGVGKTAIAEGLALKIIENDVPEKLQEKEIYLLDVVSLVAGTGIRGQFEEKMQRLLQEMAQNPQIIVFIDEIHLVVGAGKAEGSMDAGNILKPALARGEVQIIGATTLKEYREIEKDAALERRFQAVRVAEPTTKEAIQILTGIQNKYEAFHQVVYEKAAIDACVHYAERYIQDRQLPDKAIDLLDIAGAKKNLHSREKRNQDEDLTVQAETLRLEKEQATVDENYELAAYLRDKEVKLLKQLNEEKETTQKLIPRVTVEDIQHIVEKQTGIPVRALQTNEKKKLVQLQEQLAHKVIGQPVAVEKVTKAIRRSRAGLKSKHRPTASFLFVGPTGVGKTELTKALAEELFGSRESLIRLDMSEFMEKHSASKLIGSPPGYIGYDEGGQLTEKIRRNPYSILLLDEIEKAHPDIQNIFLQILEDGHLTDAQGRVVNFKETVIIATSNAGTTTEQKSSLGFHSETQKETSLMEQLKPFFRPEFLNRFDHIIEFESLAKQDLVKIVELLLKDLNESLQKQNITLHVSTALKEQITQIGYDKQFGARPLRRAIQEQIEDVITDWLLTDETIRDTLYIDFKDGKVVLS